VDIRQHASAIAKSVLPNMQADAAAIVDEALRAALNKRETKG